MDANTGTLTSNGTSLRRVQQRPLRDIIHQQLLDNIVSGVIAPGTRLNETELAAELGTSRIPVREALQELAKDRWLDLRPRQGAWVHVPTQSEVLDAFGVRGALEVEACRLASLRATEADLASLGEIVDRAQRLLKTSESPEVAPLNADFHRVVTSMSGNELLSRMVTGLDMRIQWYFTQVVPMRSFELWDEHAQILNAISKKEPGRAGALMRAHTEEMTKAYAESFSVMQDKRPNDA